MLSQRAAATAWGVSRTTLQRAIKSGKLSVQPDGSIDPSEMLRAFGEARSGSVGHPTGPLGPPVGHPDKTALLAELDRLKVVLSTKDAMIAAKDDMLAEKDARIADLRQAMNLLSAPIASKPLWKKLFGG